MLLLSVVSSTQADAIDLRVAPHRMMAFSFQLLDWNVAICLLLSSVAFRASQLCVFINVDPTSGTIPGVPDSLAPLGCLLTAVMATSRQPVIT